MTETHRGPEFPHLMDIYRIIGVEWGHDPFPRLNELVSAATQSPVVSVGDHAEIVTRLDEMLSDCIDDAKHYEEGSVRDGILRDCETLTDAINALQKGTQ